MEDGGADEASGPGEDEVHFMRGDLTAAIYDEVLGTWRSGVIDREGNIVLMEIG